MFLEGAQDTSFISIVHKRQRSLRVLFTVNPFCLHLLWSTIIEKIAKILTSVLVYGHTRLVRAAFSSNSARQRKELTFILQTLKFPSKNGIAVMELNPGPKSGKQEYYQLGYVAHDPSNPLTRVSWVIVDFLKPVLRDRYSSSAIRMFKTK